jgi:UDP-N-acetylglucosamine--N-acetylmuramyl-(pentapeptide) pyrophosphoryl-undecaprenol N-acetylglucosamine transferase
VRLADAHLFIGRAGASTIAELTAVGRPAILVPLPIATDDHQAANVREMVKAGGARSIRQPKFTAAELAKQIQAMAMRPETLATAAHGAWNCGRPNAAADLADLMESFGGTPIQDVIRVGGGEGASDLVKRASTSSARAAVAQDPLTLSLSEAKLALGANGERLNA